MKIKMFFLLLVVSLCLLVGCTPGNTKEEEEKWVNPIASVQVKEDTFDVEKLVGTYEMFNISTTRYYYVSICSDGKVICVPKSFLYSTYDDELFIGEWSLSDTKALTINIMGTTYENKVLQDYTDSTTGKKKGFKFSLNKYYSLSFEKISDNYISTEIYSNSSLLYDCYWVRTDDYGVSYAYKFYADGKYEYFRSTREDGCSTSDFSISKKGCKIKLDLSSLSSEYNYCVINDYLYLGSTSYKCVGKNYPVNKDSEVQIKDNSIIEKVIGVWIQSDKVNEDQEDVYGFSSDMTVYRVGSYAEGHKFRERGTWSVSNGKLTLVFDSTTISFDPTFEVKKSIDYMNGSTLGSFWRMATDDFVLDDFKSRPASCGTVLTGTWSNDSGVIFTFYPSGSGYVAVSGASTYVTWNCEDNDDNRITISTGNTVYFENAQWCIFDVLVSENDVKSVLLINKNNSYWMAFSNYN